MPLDITDFNHFFQLVFSQYLLVQSGFETMILAYAKYISLTENTGNTKKKYLIISFETL